MPSANERVAIAYGTQSSYDDIQIKDDNTIYFITDTGRIYVGTSQYYTTMNTATKQYIDNAIGNITEMDYQVVNLLPETGQKGIIYLILHEHGSGDTYDEYMWIDGQFEKIGNTDIDLSGYFSKSEIVTLTSAEYNDLTSKTASYYFITDV